MRSFESAGRTALFVVGLLAFSTANGDCLPAINQEVPAVAATPPAGKIFPNSALQGGGIRPKMSLNSTTGSSWPTETEPNGSAATATPIALVGGKALVQENLFPNGDIDYYSFTGNAGDRVYAAVTTSLSAGSSTDSQVTLYATDGVTPIEFDDDNGSFAGLS